MRNSGVKLVLESRKTSIFSAKKGIAPCSRPKHSEFYWIDSRISACTVFHTCKLHSQNFCKERLTLIIHESSIYTTIVQIKIDELFDCTTRSRLSEYAFLGFSASLPLKTNLNSLFYPNNKNFMKLLHSLAVLI